MLRFLKYFFLTILVIILLTGISVAIFIYHLSKGLPSVDFLKTYRPPSATIIYSSDGKVIGEFFKERRYYVPLSEIPPVVRKAFIAAEDAHFYEHKGIDIFGIIRAAWKNIEAGEIVQGGSTITQQVVKALLLTPKKSFTRKIKEIILAHRIEKHLSKDRILEIYLNQIYLGHGAYGVEAASRTYFGKSVWELTLPEAALLAGLPKAPSKYDPLRNFKLAKERLRYVLRRMWEEGMISEEEREKASNYQFQFKEYKSRFLNTTPYFTEYVRRYLLEKYGEKLTYGGGLVVYTTVNVSLYKAAERALLKGLKELERRRGYKGPLLHLSDDEIDRFIDEESKDFLGLEELEKGRLYKGVVISVDRKRRRYDVVVGPFHGYIPFSSIKWARKLIDVDGDVIAYRRPWNVLKRGDVIRVSVKGIDGDRYIFDLEQDLEVQGAIYTLDLRDWEIRVVLGGRNFKESQFNRVLQARRQPGSAFKPIIYSVAFDNGFTTASIIDDSPIIVKNPDGSEWRPRNFTNKFYGPTRLREALVFSRNVVTVKLLRKIGVKKVIERARTLGITSPLPNDLTLALGSCSITPYELINAYSVIACYGVKRKPIFIRKIYRGDDIIEDNTREPLKDVSQYLDEEWDEKRVISKQTAYLIIDVLKDVVKRGTGRRVRSIGRPCAGKTGTTNDQRDAWFIGFTPQLITGVWVGFDDMRSLGKGETGSRAASPIWLYFMREAVKGLPPVDFPIPNGIVFARIDPKTGRLIKGGSGGMFEVFKKGELPPEKEEEGGLRELLNY